MACLSPGPPISMFWPYVSDDRFPEPRFRLYGLIDGVACCVAGTDRDGVVRVISLRRAHAKEMKRYVS